VSVAIAALVLGKSVLLADMLPMINRFPQKPLIYDVAWKTPIYLIVAAVLHYVDHLIDFVRQAGGLIAGNERSFAEMSWPSFWAMQILLFVLIVMYCTIDDLARVTGKQKFMRMFFGLLPT
jgi:hypothetical protein